MTKKETDDLILEAIDLNVKIAELETQLESKKAKLRGEAAKVAAEHGITELPGTSWTFITKKGPIARVSFPKPGLVRGFWFVGERAFKSVDGKVIEIAGDLRKLCGMAFNKLFAQNYKPAKAFRELLPALLPEAMAAKVLALCEEEPSAARVSFEVKAS